MANLTRRDFLKVLGVGGAARGADRGRHTFEIIIK